MFYLLVLGANDVFCAARADRVNRDGPHSVRLVAFQRSDFTGPTARGRHYVKQTYFKARRRSHHNFGVKQPSQGRETPPCG